jgi:predicted AAA+ superfamily ATPase
MRRYISNGLLKDLHKKPILLSGPRQCGKTYLSKHLVDKQIDYLNYDVPSHRGRLLKQEWSRDAELNVFDELHKMKKWKSWLKGVFDDNENNAKFLVTGSAKLNTFKKVGDSLAGRYFSYRLYPFDLKELYQNIQASTPLTEPFFKSAAFTKSKDLKTFLLDRLLSVSGFPEPFLDLDSSFHKKWQQTHLDVILRQDILDSEHIRNIKQLETLVYLLTERVGSPLSYNSLREDLSTDDKSIKRWTDILENAYVLFRIYPYTNKSLSNTIKKSPKIYFYDYSRISQSAARLENLVALALLKEVHWLKDVKGQEFDLHFIRNRQGKEIDFLITKGKNPHLLIEVKESDDSVSDSFSLFDKYCHGIKKIQIVKNVKSPYLSKNKVHVVRASEWLSEVKIDK